jgi:hypothetical protein
VKDFIRSESIKPYTGDTLQSENGDFEENQEIEKEPETRNYEQENFIKMGDMAPEIGIKKYKSMI